MKKSKGVHLYMNVRNLLEIIAQEEASDEDLKRTLHRLHTHFLGLTKLAKKYGCRVEKFTGGRVHFLIDGDNASSLALKLFVACFIFNNEIFNKLGKYSGYTGFSVHAGMDIGEYYEHTIEDKSGSEFTTIGRAANNAAKIQSFAPRNVVLVTQKFIEDLPEEHREKFAEVSDEEKEAFGKRLKGDRFYKAHYSNVLGREQMDEIRGDLKDVKTRVEQEANAINILDIAFESCTKRLSFENLSLTGTNKKLDSAGVMCADIRGFTKLFNLSDSNLDDLIDVVASIYDLFSDAINEGDGTRVQYQGDRIIVIFNEYSGGEDHIIRMLRGAFCLNQKVQELNDNPIIQAKLKNKTISIGVGCAVGSAIATRLGMRRNKDNIVLSEAYGKADECEDKYAESDRVVVHKQLHDLIEEQAKIGDPRYLALNEMFTSIGTTGYYESSGTLDEFQELVATKKSVQDSVESVFSTGVLTSPKRTIPDMSLRPWGHEPVKSLPMSNHRPWNPPPFKLGYDFDRYARRVEKDYSIVQSFFPLLKMVRLPTRRPHEIYLEGKLVPLQVWDTCKHSKYDLHANSIQIFAVYASNYDESELYVIDREQRINWNRLPCRHHHYRFIEGNQVLCTHHPDGEIQTIRKNKRSLAVLLSAWRLFIQCERYVAGSSWTLDELDHGANALEQRGEIRIKIRRGEVSWDHKR